MIVFVRTNSANKDFVNLVKKLDEYLAICDGEEHNFYHQFNKIDAIKYVVIAYENDMVLGCGAIKEYDENIMEVKRMFTTKESRNKGVATKILKELELWTKELLFKKCILETGIKQTEAINLYKKNNYKIIQNYGQYANVKSSVCFEKII